MSMCKTKKQMAFKIMGALFPFVFLLGLPFPGFSSPPKVVLRGKIHQIFLDFKAGKFSADCKKASEEEIQLVCRLVEYLRTGNAEKWLSFSDAKNEMRILDKIDMTYHPEEGKPFVKDLIPNWDVAFFYFDKVMELMKKGNPLATTKFLALYKSSDGFYAEYFDDILYRFFQTDLPLIIQNWDLFRGKLNQEIFMTTGFDSKGKKNLIGNAKKICKKSPSKNCEKALLFLNSLEYDQPKKK